MDDKLCLYMSVRLFIQFAGGVFRVRALPYHKVNAGGQLYGVHVCQVSAPPSLEMAPFRFEKCKSLRQE